MIITIGRFLFDTNLFIIFISNIITTFAIPKSFGLLLIIHLNYQVLLLLLVTIPTFSAIFTFIFNSVLLTTTIVVRCVRNITLRSANGCINIISSTSLPVTTENKKQFSLKLNNKVSLTVPSRSLSTIMFPRTRSPPFLLPIFVLFLTTFISRRCSHIFGGTHRDICSIFTSPNPFSIATTRKGLINIRKIETFREN